MVLDQLAEKRVVPVGHHIIIPQAGAHEHLFDALDLPQLPQQVEVIGMVGLEVLARGGEQAALVPAQAVPVLLFAGGEAEVGRRPADVVDIALEARVRGDLPGFGEHAFVAARLDIAPLVEGERAEVARAEAAAVVDDGELHLLDGGHAAERLIGRVVGALVWQGVDAVHLLRGERARGRVLHEHAFAVALQEGAAVHKILLVVLLLNRAGIVRLVRAGRLVGGALGRGERQAVRAVRQIGHAAHADAGRRPGFAVLQVVREREDGMLAHAVHQAVRRRGFQDGGHDAVRPVVVMRKTAQGRLDAAQVNGRVREGAARQHGIDGHGAVGAAAALAAGGVGVVRAALLRRRVVRDHGVDIAAVDQHGVARLPHCGKVGLAVEIGLGQDGDLIARVLQHARDDGRAKGGVVDVGVAGDEQEVAVIPAARLHFRARDRKKIRHGNTSVSTGFANRTVYNHKRTS